MTETTDDNRYTEFIARSPSIYRNIFIFSGYMIHFVPPVGAEQLTYDTREAVGCKS